MGLGIEKLSEKTINSVAQKYAPTGSVIETSKKAEEKSSQYMNSTAHRILANTPRTTYNSRTSF